MPGFAYSRYFICRSRIDMRHKPDWTFSSLMALAFGLECLVLGWLIIYQGVWPYIAFPGISAVPGLAFGTYAQKTYESRVAVLAIMLNQCRHLQHGR